MLFANSCSERECPRLTGGGGEIRTRKALSSHGQRLCDSRSQSLHRVVPRMRPQICALGTTSSKAGSKEAFRQVDYVLPLAFAKLAHQQGAETFALVSAIGADANSSFFYPKTKGEVERDMKLVGFKSLTILRPSIIGGKRDESRFAEGLALTLSRILAPVLPKKFHVNPAAKIASALLDSVIAAVPGCHYRYAESLT